MTSQELKDKKAELVGQITDLNNLAKTEKRSMSEKENTDVDAWFKEIEDLKVELTRQVKIDAMNAETAKSKGKSVGKTDNSEKRLKDISGFRFMNVVKAQAQMRPLDGIEKELHQEAELEATRNGLSMDGYGTPSPGRMAELIGKRDLDVTNATAGGNTVQTDIGALIPVLRPTLLSETLGATVLNGLSGNLTLPTHATATSATAEGEDDVNAESTPTFGTVAMTPNRIGAYTEITKQLMMQSSIDVENLVRNDLNRAMATFTDEAIFDMIVAKTGTGSVAAGTNGAALTWADVLEFESDVATSNAEQGRLAYVTTPGVRGALKGTLKSTGVGGYIWENNMLNGYAAHASTQLPSDLSKGSSTGVLHAMIYGNWAELIIGYWGGVDIVVDPYSLSKNAKIQLVVNRWYDTDVRHAASFSTCEDIAVA